MDFPLQLGHITAHLLQVFSERLKRPILTIRAVVSGDVEFVFLALFVNSIIGEMHEKVGNVSLIRRLVFFSGESN